MQSLRLPATEENLPQFLLFAQESAEAAGLDMGNAQRVELVLEEALVNVIRHAYAKSPPEAERPVELSANVDPDGVLRLTLKDWGQPFDPVGPPPAPLNAPLPLDELPDPLTAELEASLLSNLEADLEHRALGGMGLFLIRTMSEPSYARQDEANVLSLRFAPQEDQADE